MIITNPYRNETYYIRAVPMAEALQLRANGTVMYDYTKLTAVNTCPTFGVIRYGLHKTEIPMTASGRNLAVECGKACHEYFAALRMWTLIQKALGAIAPATDAYGKKLFGTTRWGSMLAQPQDAGTINNAINFSLEALHTAGYYDDPSDRKRTMSNMEASCIGYTERYLQMDIPVFVKGDLIGVEIPFVLEVKRMRNGIASEEHPNNDEYLHSTHYYCGRIDGVHHYGSSIAVGENKTAASLNQSWRTSFAVSHQITGYTIAGSEIFGETIEDALVMGAQIPLPVKEPFNGVAFEPQRRSVDDRIRWCEWFFDSISTYERHIKDPTLAPRFPHSCNRFFSVCQFIPFCTSDRLEQIEYMDSMRVEEWSPLDHLIDDGVVD